MNIGMGDLYSILDLKKRIKDKEGTPLEDQRLIYAGVNLEDGRLLEDYGIRDGAAVHLVLIL